MDVEKPDEKSIMTYVAQFLKKYPDADTADGASASAPEPKVGYFLYEAISFLT